MSTTNKTVLSVVVIAIIVLLAVFALRAHAPSQNTAENTGDTSSLPTAANDTSDAALQKDAAAIDTQLSGLDSDNATVDQGISESSQ